MYGERVDIIVIMDKIVFKRIAMKRRILFLLCCVITSMAFAFEVDEIIDKTIEKYENLKSLHAEFEQLLCDEVSGTCQDVEGEIYFLKPSYFRMEMKNPRQIYVGDSTSLWIYIPGEKRAIKQHLEQVPFAINPDFFLKNYDERFTAELTSEEKDRFLVSLIPKEETEIYERITISIHKTKFEIMAVTVLEKTGSKNTFIFSQIEVNKRISKKLFEFNPPDGIQIDEY